jgi:hypothetical protein
MPRGRGGNIERRDAFTLVMMIALVTFGSIPSASNPEA